MYVEYRRTVRRSGAPRFLHVDELEGKQGFRGVYGVDETTARAIEKHGDVSPLSKTPVKSSVLFIDFDTDEGVEETKEILWAGGIEFEQYSTGRRGAHFHIAIKPMRGVGVPFSQHEWVRENIPGAWDPTVYRATSIYRLPGTWHEKKAGARKELVAANYGGAMLEIPYQEQAPKPVRDDTEAGDRNPSVFYANLCKNADQRNSHVFYMGVLSKQCDIEYQKGLDSVKWWARSLCNPPLDVSDHEIERQFRNGRNNA